MNNSDAPLDASERSVLATLRQMDDETKHEAVEILKNLARDFPRAPRLHLVSVRST